MGLGICIGVGVTLMVTSLKTHTSTHRYPAAVSDLHEKFNNCSKRENRFEVIDCKISVLAGKVNDHEALIDVLTKHATEGI